MSDILIDRLKKGEEALEAYEAFRRDPKSSETDKKAVAFAYLFELFVYAGIHDLIPDYVPPKSIQIQIAQSLGGARGYITVEDGKVKISPEYYTFQAKAQEIKNKKKDV